MPYSDEEKRGEYKRHWNKHNYRINRETELKRVAKRKNEIKKWFKNYKRNLRCEFCKEDHPACIVFHHQDENKEIGVSDLVYRGYSQARILEEIDKCKTLYANCHRKLHASEKPENPGSNPGGTNPLLL